MESQTQDLSPNRPLTIADLMDDTNYLPISQDILQLQVDMLNVYEGRVAIETFPSEYQERIMNYYRFSANRQNTVSPKIAKMTPDTLDLI